MFYRKPLPETMKKNREIAQEQFSEEIKWCKDNLQTLVDSKHKFLTDMYQYLVTGSRKITPKMAIAIKNSIEKCKKNPKYSPELQTEANERLRPILEKIVMVERLAEKKNDKAQEFVRSVKQYVQMNYRITKKQMEGLNKVYKRCTEDLFDKE